MRAFLPLLDLSVAACTSFQGARPVDQLPSPVPAEQRIEVWTRGTSYQLHAVRIEGDSLLGVRWWHSPDCDSCRVSIARAEVDSVRMQRYDGGETGALTLLVVPILFVSAMVYILAHSD